MNGEAIVFVVGVGAAVASGVGAYRISGPYGNVDPRVHRSYDAVTKRPTVIMADVDGRGKTDTWYYMDANGRLIRMEVDRDGDGVVDRWEYFAPDGTLQKIGFSTKKNGLVDAWRYRGPGGALVKIEYSATGDGNITSTEYFDNGKRVRIEPNGAERTREQ